MLNWEKEQTEKDGLAAFAEYNNRPNPKGQPGPCPYYEGTDAYNSWWDGFCRGEDSSQFDPMDDF